jgi:hypothetical protein
VDKFAENFKYLTQIVDVVFAVACSNAECKRIFSFTNLQWTGERNTLNFDTVPKLISLLLNSDCIPGLKMFKYLQTVEDIGKKIVGSEKYKIVV